MSIKERATLEVGYPVYGTKFVNNKTLLVAGGGGEGNNGIPNKITVIKCSFKVKDKNRKLQRFREITLPANEDSPTCIDTCKITDTVNDTTSYSVFLGCNQSTQLIKSMNINNYLRKYVYTDDEHLKFVDAAQLEEEISPENADVYPKIVNLAKDNSLGALMTSQVPSSITFFSPDMLEVVSRFVLPTGGEIRDFHLNPTDNGKSLVYITSSSFEIISTTNNNSVHSSAKFDSVEKMLKNYILTKVRYISESELIFTGTLRNGKGVGLLKYSITNQKFVNINNFSKKIKGLVALDFSDDQNLIAVSGNDFSLTLLRLSDLKVLKTFKKLHPFALTDVAFSPNGSKLATGSASNSVIVFKIPKNYANGTSIVGTVINYLFYAIIFALLAIFLQVANENGQLEQYYQHFLVYSEKSWETFKDFSVTSFDFIKDKIKNEKLDGDDNTKQYFTMDTWEEPSSASKTSETIADSVTKVIKTEASVTSIEKTPMGEPVDTMKDEIVEEPISKSEDVSSIPEVETEIETTSSVSSIPVDHQENDIEYAYNTSSTIINPEFTDKKNLDEGYEADNDDEDDSDNDSDTISASTESELSVESPIVVDEPQEEPADDEYAIESEDVEVESETADEEEIEVDEAQVEVRDEQEESTAEEEYEETDDTEEYEASESEEAEVEEAVEDEEEVVFEEIVAEEEPVHEESSEENTEEEEVEVSEEADIEKVEDDSIEEETSEVETSAESDAELDSQEESETETVTEYETLTESEGEVETEVESETDLEVETEAESESETEIDIPVESESETDIEIESQSETESIDEYYTEVDSDFESTTDISQYETSTDSESEVSDAESVSEALESESETESDIEVKDEPEAIKVETDSETESEIESEAEFEVPETDAAEVVSEDSEQIPDRETADTKETIEHISSVDTIESETLPIGSKSDSIEEPPTALSSKDTETSTDVSSIKNESVKNEPESTTAPKKKPKKVKKTKKARKKKAPKKPVHDEL